MRAERTNEIEEGPNGTTVYRTWQSFSGPGARIVRWQLEQTLRDRMSDWCRDLKAWSEKIEAQPGDDVKEDVNDV